MKMLTRRGLRAAAFFLAAVGLSSAWAAGGPINIVTPLAAGSASDVALRIVAEKLTAALGQPIIVDNQTGASGAIGAEKVARAAPDGGTLCGCNNAVLVVLPHLRKVGFDPVKSFRPVGMVAVLSLVMVVNPSLPVKNVQEFVAYAKANPGKVSYATGGVGSAQHIAMSMFETATGLKLLHVPYKGASPSAVAVAAGEVQVMFNAIGSVIPLIKAGKLRAIAVGGAQRTSAMASVPTVAEQGVPGYDYTSWLGIVAPAGTSDEVVNRISAELTKVLREPETVKRLADNGMDPSVMTPAQMSDYLAVDFARMAKVVTNAGMKE